jgi:threonine aldolase
MPFSNRRNFLKISGLSIIPVILPVSGFSSNHSVNDMPPPDEPLVKFFGDGEMFEPAAYLDILMKMNAADPLVKDRYGEGGAVAALEKKMEIITGKEKALFMPSGTMANQLAIARLSTNSTKVFVQETSHVFRDEADAAQSVFQKRLMPLAKGEPYFTAAILKQAIESLAEEEVFSSGIGTVSIENPVRRADGRMVPIEEIRAISEYCRSYNIKLHLDGARIFMAAAWSGITVKEYAAYFDTVYISLYKYLGAAAGAILCGQKMLMDEMPHQVKIHGGSMYSNWANAAMALHRLQGMEDRLQNAKNNAAVLFNAVNKIPGIQINALQGGTNIYELQLAKGINGNRVQSILKDSWFIRIPRPDKNNRTLLTVNETLLYRDTAYIIEAFKKAIL